tara:strand:- start:64 stop:639 length:576 start_codon:yes stop_codon:yes gene_type:complete
MTSASVVSDIQKSNPSAIIELFELQLIAALHNSTATYRFHAGTNENNNGAIIWGGNTYTRLPIQADGFGFSGKQMPRPTLRVANGTATISAILIDINKFTAGNDLGGAKVTRIRTLAKFIDAANWASGTNPYGTPDPTAKFPDEIYFVDRKAAENRFTVDFELVAALDLQGVRAPKRLCTRAEFPSIGTFV